MLSDCTAHEVITGGSFWLTLYHLDTGWSNYLEGDVAVLVGVGSLLVESLRNLQIQQIVHF